MLGPYITQKELMMVPVTQRQKAGKEVLRQPRTYNEVVSYLDSCKHIEYGQSSLERVKRLDKHFGTISSKVETILVGGTNGKSSAIHFASKLLKEESLKVGSICSSHILTYNERLSVDFQSITNKAFSEVVSSVIDAVEFLKLKATAFEIMTIASLLYFKAEGVDVALLEVGVGGKYDATAICKPQIAAVTRIALDHQDVLGADLDDIAFEMMETATKGTWFISAEQSKIRLQKMKDWAKERGIRWAMPIRKLAALPYIYEQLYGRTASLGERMAQIYVEDIKGKFSPFLRGNLLATQRGQRGRPTLEAKRQAELNPIKTLKKFWNEEFNLLRGRFELLDKEKPSILVDIADNIDALTNVFLGLRLLHYQRPLKDFSLIIGLDKNIDVLETMKVIRYLLKKVNGCVSFVSLPDGHDAEELVKLAKNINIKSKGFASFAQAFETLKSNVDDHEGLIAITGSRVLVSEYWKHRGMKKL